MQTTQILISKQDTSIYISIYKRFLPHLTATLIEQTEGVYPDSLLKHKTLGVPTSKTKEIIEAIMAGNTVQLEYFGCGGNPSCSFRDCPEFDNTVSHPRWFDEDDENSNDTYMSKCWGVYLTE